MSSSNRLHHHLANMVAFEKELTNAMNKLSALSIAHCDAKQILDEVASTSASHFQALKTRLTTIADGYEIPKDVLPDLKLLSEDYPVSSALQQASSLLNSGIIGYAMLISISKRYRDSVFIGDDNTDDLAQLHTKHYVSATHRVNQLINSVVLWELNSDSDMCQCSCPSCTVGICLCAQAPRLLLSNFWAEQGPISTESAVLIHTPRSGSAAESAGLRQGDVVIEADGQGLENHFTLQNVVQTHGAGEKVALKVLRSSGEVEEVDIRIP